MTSASLYTHVMRYCETCTPRCRGHREPRPPVADYGQASAYKKPQRKTPPMRAERRIRAYNDQTRFHLTPRQLRRMAKAYRSTEAT